MKVFLVALTLSAVIAFAVGDLRYRSKAIHKNYPNQCYYEELQQPIPKYQTYKPSNRNGQSCESIYCRPDYVLEIEFCGRHNLVADDKCRIVSEKAVAYPQCCPKLVCRDDDNLIDQV